jgi:hypothetical protein
VLPLALGLAIQAISWIVEIGISISKKSYLQLPAFITSLAVTLAAILWLAPLFGLIGVAFAVFAGHAVRAVICAVLAQRVYPIPWAYRPILTMIFMAIGLSVGVHFSASYGPIAMAIMQAIAAIIIVFIGPFVLLNQEERIHFLVKLNAMRRTTFPRIIGM